MKIAHLAAAHKFSVALFLLLKPLGIWGLAALALIDAAVFPIPVSMDAVIVGYVAAAHSRFLPYCLLAALASAVGSLVPYYLGRAGGELFLLKRVNRERYESMRDRFESQEFLAIMIPAMLPPPTPMKLFEFAAGVFEMRPLPYLLAVFIGKFIQFLVCALLTIFFGPTLWHSLVHQFHYHLGHVLLAAGILVLAAAYFLLRRLFDRRASLAEVDEEETLP